MTKVEYTHYYIGLFIDIYDEMVIMNEMIMNDNDRMILIFVMKYS